MSLKAFLSDGSLPKAAGNLLGGLKTKAGEVGTKIKNAFSGPGDFKKIAKEADPFEEAAAQLAEERAAIDAQDPNQVVMDAIDQDIRDASPDPFYANDVDRDIADQEAAAAAETDNVSAADINAAKAEPEKGDKHKVSLEEIGQGGLKVTFNVMPEVVESRQAEYEAVAPPQSPGAFQKYKGTASTQWTVNATLVCRTTAEATSNLQTLNILRSWTMPFFGERTAELFPQKLGAPPPVLKLHGWRAQMVGPVHVVITSLNWNFPQDVDYIPAQENKLDENGRLVATGRLIPFPTVIKIAIQLVETFSTERMNGFSLGHFRNGQFEEAFAPLKKTDTETQVPQKSAEAQAAPNPTARVGTERGRGTNLGNVVTQTATIPPMGNVNKVVSEAKTVGAQDIKSPVKKFVSGGGGDFGGGGATGSF